MGAGAATSKVYIWVYDHRTLGKDKLLGDGEIDVGSLSSVKSLSVDWAPLDLASYPAHHRVWRGRDV